MRTRHFSVRAKGEGSTNERRTFSWIVLVGAVSLATFFRINPLEEWIATGYLGGVVQRLRDDPAWRGRTGRMAVPGNVFAFTNGGDAYVLVNDGGRMEIFFPEHHRQVRIVWGSGRNDEVRVEADGFLYSDFPPPKDAWIDVPNASPPIEGMSPWGRPPIRPRWYSIEPFYSD